MCVCVCVCVCMGVGVPFYHDLVANLNIKKKKKTYIIFYFVQVTEATNKVVVNAREIQISEAILSG